MEFVEVTPQAAREWVFMIPHMSASLQLSAHHLNQIIPTSRSKFVVTRDDVLI
jgi:hypothetical protein